jgi:hypothetical protein
MASRFLERPACRVVPLLAMALVAVPAFAQRRDVPAAERARDADQVVVGRVTAVAPVWQTNDFGDRLIVSIVHVAVEETLKGTAQSAVDVEVEGGTIGTLTLRVSDLDAFAPGDRAVFYLEHNRRGALVPHRRDLGLQRLDAAGRARESGATLDDIRREVRAGLGRAR